jgi:hypothetical protein
MAAPEYARRFNGDARAGPARSITHMQNHADCGFLQRVCEGLRLVSRPPYGLDATWPRDPNRPSTTGEKTLGIKRKLASVFVAALVGALAFAGTANAATTYTLNDDGYGGCTKPTNGAWTTYGAYSHVHVSDSIVVNSLTSIHINYSNSNADLSDCGPAGRLVTGGNISFTNHWQADGSKLTTCTISAGGGCTINAGQTVASRNYTKSQANTNGTAVFNGGGWNIYAGSTGWIDDFAHDADVTFSYSTWATAAGSGNILYL